MDGFGFSEQVPAELGAPAGSPIRLSPVPLKYSAGLIVLLVLAVLAAVVGAIVIAQDEGEIPGALLVGIGAVMGIGAVAGISKRKRPCTLQAYDQGVAVTRGGKTTAILYDQLTAVSVEEKEVLANGVPAGILVKLGLSRGGNTMKLANYFDLGSQGAGDFGACVDRITQGRAAAMKKAVNEGRAIRGKGWTLDRDGIRGRDHQATPASLVVVCSVSAKDVKLWRAGEELPFVETPAGSPDAQALAALVAPHLPEQAPDVDVPGSLGRVLFSRKVSRKAVLFIAALGVVALLVGAALLEPEPVAAFVLIPLGALILLLAIQRMRFQIDFHTRGLKKRGLFSSRELPYSELAALTHTATRQYVNGAYTGTIHMLAFTPAAGKAISYSTQTNGSDAELEGLRDGVSAIVAQRLHGELQRSGRVTWSGDVVLTKSGIEYRRSKLFGKGEQCYMPFSDALSYQFAEGQLVLHDGSELPQVQIPCSGPNFYPGFMLLQEIVIA